MKKRINVTIDENVLEEVIAIKERIDSNLSYTIELLLAHSLSNLELPDNDYELLAYLLMMRKEIP